MAGYSAAPPPYTPGGPGATSNAQFVNPVQQIELKISCRNLIDMDFLSLIHISEPTRPLYISYAVFCLKKKTQ